MTKIFIIGAGSIGNHLTNAAIKDKYEVYITDKSNETSGNQSGYFNIKTWIEWEDPYVGNTAYKHLAFEVDQAVLMK